MFSYPYVVTLEKTDYLDRFIYPSGPVAGVRRVNRKQAERNAVRNAIARKSRAKNRQRGKGKTKWSWSPGPSGRGVITEFQRRNPGK